MLVGPNTTGIPDPQEAEAGVWHIQIHPGLQSELKTSLGNLVNVSIRKRGGRRDEREVKNHEIGR